ncbi:MAG: hypothetical protein L0216_16305 [Planctomycetales bacterium]|nr:hypothetical protein [Planctomycetales bacterium]
MSDAPPIRESDAILVARRVQRIVRWNLVALGFAGLYAGTLLGALAFSLAGARGIPRGPLLLVAATGLHLLAGAALLMSVLRIRRGLSAGGPGLRAGLMLGAAGGGLGMLPGFFGIAWAALGGPASASVIRDAPLLAIPCFPLFVWVLAANLLILLAHGPSIRARLEGPRGDAP